MHWFDEILGAADDAVRYVDKTLREPGGLTEESRDVLENLAAVMEHVAERLAQEGAFSSKNAAATR
ncbi:hypothetical protein HMPREF1147_2268 [Selenomonas sp. FOBRC9]|uniref:hypothetical protein n=1 Tax=Selenomonas sp. FOBRC9 TaxID=936573 RepID=UPI00027A44C7|nr:hypothetical protein [Selenomonas sp. FOBRC9]EJP32207.1 hypothetical protein HMPREF1147_2268 [Selenomonas sp. FOBRC9]